MSVQRKQEAVLRDLRGASFVRTRLVDVDFDGADLPGAVFEEATIVGTDLSVARGYKN